MAELTPFTMPGFNGGGNANQGENIAEGIQGFIKQLCAKPYGSEDWDFVFQIARILECYAVTTGDPQDEKRAAELLAEVFNRTLHHRETLQAHYLASIEELTKVKLAELKGN